MTRPAHDSKPSSVKIDVHATLINIHTVGGGERALLALQTASLMAQTDVVSWEFSRHSAETAVLKNAVVGLVHWKSRQLAYDDGSYSVDVDQVHGQSHDVSPSVVGRLPLVVISTGVKVDHSHVNTRQQQVVTTP